MKATLTKICIVCNKELVKWQTKFCSRTCYYSWAKENPNKGRFTKGHNRGFQKGHEVFGGVKTRFKKGHKTWNKGIKGRQPWHNLSGWEKWRKDHGGSWNKGKNIKANDALDRWRENGGKSPSGKNHWNYQGGRSKLSDRIRNLPEYKKWRTEVFKKDDYTCQDCSQRGGKLHPHHHKKRFSEILKDNNITSVKKARECKELWDKDNGQTLCINCHKQYHKSWN